MLLGTLVLLAVGLTACQGTGNVQPPEEPEEALVEQPAQAEEAVPPEPEPEPVEIEYLQHSAYMCGEDGYFFPERCLTRAETAQLLVNLFGGAAQDGAAFPDVPAEAWYASCVAAAAAYLPAYEDGNFYPGSSVTLSELIGAICRAMELALPENGEASEEAPAVDPAMALAVERGWVEETADPAQAVLRAQAAALLNRVLEREPDHDAMDALEARVFLDVSPDDALYQDILEAALDHEYLGDETGEAWNPESVRDVQVSAGFHKAGGNAQYVLEDGTILKEPGLFDVGEATYLVSEEDGQIYADDALHWIDGKVVFATADGTLLKNAGWNDFQFDADGFYTSGDEALDAYVSQVLSECTTEDMTQLEKLRACYDYVRAFRYLGRNATLPASVKTMPHENAVAYANKIFETGKGDCYNFAASFCFLARALGYEATAVVGSCGYVWSSVAIAHGWVEIVLDGATYLFDPEIENYNLRAGISNTTHGAFMVTYQSAPGGYYKN